jgi:ATP-dependent exoDNAse (exonuclease V) beta subunit
LNGIIDLFYINDKGKGQIIDYKLSEPKEAWNKEIYQMQIEIYAKALKEAGVCDKPEKLLWYLRER